LELSCIIYTERRARMRETRFAGSQIIKVLNELQGGRKVND
jgi:hypothetical protein